VAEPTCRICGWSPASGEPHLIQLGADAGVESDPIDRDEVDLAGEIGEQLAREVRDLAAVVAELRQTVEAIACKVGAEPQEPTVVCPLCHREGPQRWMEEFHLANAHCPDCGEEVARSKMLRHRRLAHGADPADICTWQEPHAHTGPGHCVCPLCHQTSASIEWGSRTMASHYTRLHTSCPDCDRSFINLAAHRRRAHPWVTLSDRSAREH
jgi:hypothetical protein